MSPTDSPTHTPPEACASVDPEVMFPEDEDGEAADEARDVCRRCPVRALCLEAAIDSRQPYGIWGGLNTRERETERRRRYRRGTPRLVPAMAPVAPLHAPVRRWEDATLPFAV